MTDFNLWATGAGACAPGKASLDYRLHQSLSVWEVITNMLCMLRILIARLQTTGKSLRKKGLESFEMLIVSIASRSHGVEEISTSNTSPRPGEISGSQQGYSLDPEKRNAAKVLDQLLKLTIEIRKAGSRSSLEDIIIISTQGITRSRSNILFSYYGKAYLKWSINPS